MFIVTLFMKNGSRVISVLSFSLSFSVVRVPVLIRLFIILLQVSSRTNEERRLNSSNGRRVLMIDPDLPVVIEPGFEDMINLELR